MTSSLEDRALAGRTLLPAGLPPSAPVPPPSASFDGSQTTIFRSIHHPGHAQLPFVVARAQAQPVALALTAVMIATLGAVLRGEAVLGTVAWAAPLAYFVAAAWSLYELQRRPAEIVIRHGLGTVRSVWDVARTRGFVPDTLRLHPLFEPGKKDGQLFVGIGDEVVTLRAAEWPQYRALLDALRAGAAELQGVSFELQ
jgi:hypothetical protein